MTELFQCPQDTETIVFPLQRLCISTGPHAGGMTTTRAGFFALRDITFQDRSHGFYYTFLQI